MDINILLFPDFETLDAFGPVEIFGCIDDYHLHFVSIDGGAIKSRQGTRPLVNDRDFIEVLKQIASKSIYCLTVCTGSALLAKTGLLDRRQATTNKRAFEWVKSISSSVDWIARARWVVDGKFYTSSGVSAGMDMSLGFIADRFGSHVSADIADAIEYIWNADKGNDLFAREY